ncbi:MAG: AAA family ATPase [Acidobacteriia bacterium]|nr:AAA family ATPase [Terriglobia bacterium]
MKGAYQIVQAESYWDCIDSLRRDDAYKAHLVDALAELRRQPFRNPKLRTHEIGVASNGRKLFSSDVGGRASNRRVVWQLFNRTIVVLLYGTHAVQDRAKRIRVAFDQQHQLVQIYERSPDSGVERPYREQRARVGKLFMAWSDAELMKVGFPEPAVEHLRQLNTVDELFDLEEHLGSSRLERAFDLVAGVGSPSSEDQPTVPDAPPVLHADEPGHAAAPTAVSSVAGPPQVTADDLELERLLNDERTGAWFTRVEPEFLAEIIGRPIEDWMIFLHPDQRTAATRRYQGPARVRGAAGTGKTVVGLHRAADLAARNRAALAERSNQLLADPEPIPPVLFTTYIRTLSPVFEELYLRMPGTRIGEVEFVNVDKLARRVCAEEDDRPFVNSTKITKAYGEAFRQVIVPGTPLHGRFTRQYLRDEITHVIKGRAVEALEAYLELARTGRRAALGRLQRTQVWELMECWDAQMARHGTIDFPDVIRRALEHARRRSRPSYSAVIVDEAQDLTLAGLQFLRALVNAPDHRADRPDGLFILGDGAQRIYPGGFTLRQAGVEVRGRTTVLTENYRNTSEIVDAAMAVAGDHQIEDLGEVFDRGAESISTVRRGPRPLLIEIDGLDAQIDEIARYVDDLVGSGDGFGPGDMAVLAPSNAAVNRVRNRLQALGRGVQPLDKYDGRPNDQIKVGTFHRGKGLEFKVVFLPELDRFPPPMPKGLSEDEAAEARELAISQLFVAMTRARDLLVILHGAHLAPEVAAASAHFECPGSGGSF